MLEKKLKKNAVEQGSLVIKVMSFQTITFLTVASQIFVFWLSAKEDFFPSIDVWRTIITTCSQIIAGLYGITMAGYTFFLSRIDGITASDFTLDYIENAILADKMGVIVGNSHHEPCCRSGQEFQILRHEHPEYGKEWSFLSNAEDRQNLTDPAYQVKLAASIFAASAEWLAAN